MKYEFTTVGGVLLELTPIPPLIYNRFRIEWEKRNERPVPPKRTVKIVDTEVAQFDHQNEYFQNELSEWNTTLNNALMDFVFVRGVKTNPPKSWSSSFPEIMPENPTAGQLKLGWLSEILEKQEDFESLQEAVVSLTEPTNDGVEEAEKN